MRKRSRRRTKRVIGYGFISENIVNLLGRPAIKVAGKAMAKAAASALGKAAAKVAGSKIGNMVANKYYRQACRPPNFHQLLPGTNL